MVGWLGFTACQPLFLFYSFLMGTQFFKKMQYVFKQIFLNSCFSIQSIVGTLTGTTTLGQSGPENNDDEGVLHISQSSRIEASPLDAV